MRIKILIAADSFKGSLSSIEVAEYLEEGISRIIDDVKIIKLSVSDGGEGCVDTVIDQTSGKKVFLNVRDPLGREIQSYYGIIDDDTAIIEMALASGLILVPEKDRNPIITTTYGTGELIRHALNNGAKKIYIGLGGSATNDGGVGMAQALGVSFKNNKGEEIKFGGGSLELIESIDLSNRHPMLENVEIIGISDVRNLLFGENGASFVFGAQKGSSQDDIKVLDNGLIHLCNKINEYLGIHVGDIPGGGAAGGLGAGIIAFIGGSLQPGVEKILDLIDFNSKVKDVDLVITGEGSIDYQTKYGKVPVGVSKRAKEYSKNVIAVCGSIGEGIEDVYESGIDLIISTINKPMSLNEAMRDSKSLMINAGETIGRLLLLINKKI